MKRKYKFTATHSLLAAKNAKAKILHEHEYIVSVILYHEVNPVCDGWTFDFDELDRRINPIISQIDGSILNDACPYEPTSEMVACWILAMMPPFIDGICVSETDRSSAEILRKDIKIGWLEKFRVDHDKKG